MALWGVEEPVELCPCPQCGLTAEVVPHDDTLVGVRCIDRHWFFGLRERLVVTVALPADVTERRA